MRRMLSSLVLVIFLSCAAVAQNPLEQIWKQATQQPAASNLPTDKIVSGLKEALKVSTTKAVAETGKPDGFLMNQAIKITLPKNWQTVERGMRMFGQGQKVDQFVVGMNRAAEQATPLAKKIFIDALMKMTITDARNILTGSDTAATEYFRRTTSEELTSAFRPIVHQSMENVGVVKQYNDLAANPLAAPLLQRQQFNIDDYVLGKTLDGLFYMMGQEEKNIRKNPAARTTQILKDVFKGLEK